MSATPFEAFVEHVNDWIAGDPASEDEVLDVWSLGERNPACAAAQIESLRRLAARRAPAEFGEIVTGLSIVPVGAALVAFFSLADEAEAATILVATREGVLSVGILAAMCGLAAGFIFGWLARAAVVPQEEPPFVDHPDVSRVVEISNRRVRS